MGNFEFVIVEKNVVPFVGLVKINRPKQLNALNIDVLGEIAAALQSFDEDPEIRAIILTGDDRAFAAGADIKAMAKASSVDMINSAMIKHWKIIRGIKKPLIAAVSGFTLGGGCELMMTCDMVIASDTSKFGQPEIKIGTMPGSGGTQRLTKAVGKVKAMELALTGRFISAKEALEYKLINKIVPVELYLKEAKKLATEIAEKSPIAAQMIKDSINKSFNMPLEEGLEYERRNFYLTFSTSDQKEGMSAFINKRKPNFEGK